MRKTSLSFLSVPALLCTLLVSGCADWEAHMQSKIPPSQPFFANKEIKVTQTRSVAEIPFADGVMKPSAAQVASLQSFLSNVDPEAKLVVLVEQPPRKASRLVVQRAKSVEALVRKFGYKVEGYTPANTDLATISVAVDHLMAVAPKCPDWKIDPYAEYSSNLMPNTGCADRSNLAAMVANPADLVSGDVPAAVSGHTATYGEIRIRRDQPRELQDAQQSFKTGG